MTRIPGKPHDKGLMLYNLGTYSMKVGQKPYILCICPHWGVQKPTPLDAAKQMLHMFADYYKYKPHSVLGKHSQL